MESYVVHIYRRKEQGNKQSFGTVERPELKDKKVFTTKDQLWDILNPGAQGQEAPNKTSKQ